MADIPNLPNPSELKWDLGVFNGQPCDVGGGGHKYLTDYQDELKIKYMDPVMTDCSLRQGASGKAFARDLAL